jgi:serine/threonine protein kinase
LIPFIGICMVAQQMYFVSKFIERGSLKSLLCTPSEHGGDALRRYYAHPLHCLRAAIEIAEGLMHMHAHHIVHRDVSARNILVSKEGKHVVSDLGLSRWMEKKPVDGADASSAASSSVAVAYEDVYSMHTLTALPARWTAPECLRSQRFSEKSDVWGLGQQTAHCVADFCALATGLK